jgi:hypothetical protein
MEQIGDSIDEVKASQNQGIVQGVIAHHLPKGIKIGLRKTGGLDKGFSNQADKLKLQRRRIFGCTFYQP